MRIHGEIRHWSCLPGNSSVILGCPNPEIPASDDQPCVGLQDIYDTSTVYWCIASKFKVPLMFFMELIKRFCGRIYHFSISLTLVVLQRHKSLPDIGGTTIQDVGHLAVMRAAMEPGVHTMSDELILQISCNIFLAFKRILMMTWGQNISHYTTAKLSVHVWNHDLIWWQNKIDTQKHFRKTTVTSSWTLSKTKIPITIVKAQMPSNPNQKSRTRDNKLWLDHLRLCNPAGRSWNPPEDDREPVQYGQCRGGVVEIDE